MIIELRMAHICVLHGQNAAVVDSIIDQKMQSGQFKDHHEESATLHYVLLDLSQLHEDQVEDRVGVATEVDVELGTQARQSHTNMCTMLFFNLLSCDLLKRLTQCARFVFGTYLSYLRCVHTIVLPSYVHTGILLFGKSMVVDIVQTNACLFNTSCKAAMDLGSTDMQG